MIEGESLIDEHQYQSLVSNLAHAQTKSELLFLSVNAPLSDKKLISMLDIGMIELFIKDENILSSIAVSDTQSVREASKVRAGRTKSLKIPMRYTENSVVESIVKNRPQTIDDWSCLYSPILSSEASRLKQTASSIECSIIVPLKIDSGGAMVFSFIQPLSNITKAHKEFTCKYSQIVSELYSSKD